MSTRLRRQVFRSFGRPERATVAVGARHCDGAWWQASTARWQQAVKDGRAFLAKWGGQAEALSWSVRDLFGLHQPPAKPLSLTDGTASIENATGAITIYRRFDKLAFGPLGDSLDDLQ